MEWEQAERWVTAALEQAPLSAPAHYLRGVVLRERSQPEAALAALRNCVFLDANFVLGHLTLADLLATLGQAERARKARQTVARLVAGRPPHELVADGDGLTVGRILELVGTWEKSW
jgi:predicted Zn-dependent protease